MRRLLGSRVRQLLSSIVAITLEFAGEAIGRTLRQSGVDLIRIGGGKIVEVRLFSSDPAQEDAFWGR